LFKFRKQNIIDGKNIEIASKQSCLQCLARARARSAKEPLHFGGTGTVPEPHQLVCSTRFAVMGRTYCQAAKIKKFYMKTRFKKK
jgi:hypothetical protein